jgi:hypothetical protein
VFNNDNDKSNNNNSNDHYTDSNSNIIITLIAKILVTMKKISTLMGIVSIISIGNSLFFCFSYCAIIFFTINSTLLFFSLLL